MANRREFSLLITHYSLLITDYCGDAATPLVSPTNPPGVKSHSASSGAVKKLPLWSTFPVTPPFFGFFLFSKSIYTPPQYVGEIVTDVWMNKSHERMGLVIVHTLSATVGMQIG